MKQLNAQACATTAWHDALADILCNGNHSAPRGIPTLEIPQRTMVIDMLRPVVMTPSRQLNYRFMAAEAFWILTGDDRVESIAKYNGHIAQFSDDGEKFFGAYGPRVVEQLDYVVKKLREDPNTRQAGMTLWRQNPPKTKDVPCTIALFFFIRGNRLNAHVFMRSSDAWLGIPYDVFSFCMLAYRVCGILESGVVNLYVPGNLYLTAASSHLYETNFEMARSCLRDKIIDQPIAPDNLWGREQPLISYLEKLRETRPGDPMRWWETKV